MHTVSMSDRGESISKVQRGAWYILEIKGKPVLLSTKTGTQKQETGLVYWWRRLGRKNDISTYNDTYWPVVLAKQSKKPEEQKKQTKKKWGGYML